MGEGKVSKVKMPPPFPALLLILFLAKGEDDHPDGDEDFIVKVSC